LDTVHPPESPFNRFIRESETRATGPGTEDMKNGAAVLLYALKALHAERRLEGRDIAIVLTGDEEAPPADSAAARRSLIDAARGREVVLSFEPGEQGVVVTSRRGFTGWQLSVSGKQAHSGSIFSKETGAGAILEASRILDSFREELLVEPSLTFNVGGLLGGTEASFDFGSGRGTMLGKQNVVPKVALAWGEFRPLTVAQAERTQERMAAIAARNLPLTGAEIRFSPGYAPMEAKAGNMALQREISAISEALGAGPLAPNDPVSRGAGDISFVANAVPAALDGLGGAGGGAHSTDEWVDLRSFRMSTKRAAILLDRLGAP
jgi:glutamate carboxypeptidase